MSAPSKYLATGYHLETKATARVRASVSLAGECLALLLASLLSVDEQHLCIQARNLLCRQARCAPCRAIMQPTLLSVLDVECLPDVVTVHDGKRLEQIVVSTTHVDVSNEPPRGLSCVHLYMLEQAQQWRVDQHSLPARWQGPQVGGATALCITTSPFSPFVGSY
jgi:hypothetical protein